MIFFSPVERVRADSLTYEQCDRVGQPWAPWNARLSRLGRLGLAGLLRGSLWDPQPRHSRFRRHRRSSPAVLLTHGSSQGLACFHWLLLAASAHMASILRCNRFSSQVSVRCAGQRVLRKSHTGPTVLRNNLQQEDECQNPLIRTASKT